jgi:DNA-binding NtrC family response regulator
MKLDAFDHLTKPIGRADVETTVKRMLRRTSTARVGRVQRPSSEPLIGSSQAMREVQKLIGMAAASDATVLVTGETGTGKELVARALHENSARAGKPFVAVNCAAIPAELLESELFGHVRGAFSGAVTDRVGRFRQADGGTLLLDEIGDMTLAMQAKILRVLQEREITPVGSTRAEKVDLRIVAATHQNLEQAVRGGLFREDLFYRLNVIPIHLPPLRERPADIIALAEHFLAASSDQAKTLSTEAVRRLLAHHWPGNVRELKNLMERLSVITRGNLIEAEDVGALVTTDGNAAQWATDPASWLQGDLASAVRRLEQAMIRKALVEAGGNRAEAARRLGIHRQLLYTKLKDYGIE